MVIVTDPITYKKLILVRQIYDEALIKSHSTHNNVDMIMAVVGFDLSIETTIKAIFMNLETIRTPKQEFQPLITETDTLLTNYQLGQIPDKAQIQYIHNIRNDAQHKAKYPNPSNVSDCRTYTRDFLQKIIKQVWDIEFDKISLADTIKDQEIKTHLLKAEEFFRNNDSKSAVKESSIAFTKTLSHVSVAIVGRNSLSIGSMGIVLQDMTGKTQKDEALFHSIKRMRETLEVFALGINQYDYRKYKKITGSIFLMGKDIVWMNEPQTIEKEDASFVVTFVINNIVQIENLVGDLKKPFGTNGWFWS